MDVSDDIVEKRGRSANLPAVCGHIVGKFAADRNAVGKHTYHCLSADYATAGSIIAGGDTK